MSWFSGTLAGQLAMFTNILAKISGYQAALGLTAAMVTEIETICQLFIAAYNHTESNKATSQGTTAWRDLLFYGEPTGEALPAAPVFTNIGAVVGTIGIITRFFEIRDLLVKLDGYTKAIGEDLMIVAPESGDPLPEANVAPALKLTVAGTGYRVTIKASLQGRDALQVEYKPNGGTWGTPKFFTKLPADFIITPQTPGQPESGHIRAIYIDENEPFGNYSPEYAVTIS